MCVCVYTINNLNIILLILLFINIRNRLLRKFDMVSKQLLLNISLYISVVLLALGVGVISLSFTRIPNKTFNMIRNGVNNHEGAAVGVLGVVDTIPDVVEAWSVMKYISEVYTDWKDDKK